MPYALRGNTVIREDTGAVVKVHPTRAKALAHLRALKINVEAQEAVWRRVDEHAQGWLPTERQLEEFGGLFKEALHPRGRAGKWIDKPGGLRSKLPEEPSALDEDVAERVRQMHDDPEGYLKRVHAEDEEGKKRASSVSAAWVEQQKAEEEYRKMGLKGKELEAQMADDALQRARANEAALQESEKTAAYAVTPHPLGPGPLWHHKGMMLPPYIQNVAAGIMKSGRPRSMAIAAAIGVIKRWATGRGGVKPEVRAAAAAALAQWEALRAAARTATAAKKVGSAASGAARSSGSSKSS